MDIQDLKQLKGLLEKLEKLEDNEKLEQNIKVLQKEVEELQEYKRRYLAIVGIVNWKEEQEKIELGAKVEKVIEENNAPSVDTKLQYKIIYMGNKNYGECARNERKARRMSMREVAEKCDLGTSTVWNIENNGVVSKHLIRKFEDGLGIKILQDDEKIEDIDNVKIIIKGHRTYGEIYREERLAQGYTLKELGKIGDISGSTIWDVETNRCKNNHNSRMKVEKALKIKVID